MPSAGRSARAESTRLVRDANGGDGAHPDYLSGHATMGGALMRLLTGILGTPRVDLRIRSITTGATRHYRYAHEYERDVVEARVRGGIAWALRTYFRPVPDHGHF
ncbi:phosphatase PAP2 family protein [Streptomyces olindensis]|uniref:hypothetical protein n=1 Tax=Streptomyces olindensis TaxID=358823 RepID=UPI003666541C